MKKIISFKSILFVFLFIVAIGTGITAYIFYNKYQEAKENPQILAEEEAKALVEDLGKLMQLPEGETPTVSTVLDKEKLKNQEFFKNTENGDKILAYLQAKKAILYRPSTRKIIEVAPIFETPQATSSAEMSE